MRGSEWRNRNLRFGVLLAGTLICIALIVQGIFGNDGLLTLRQKRRQFDSLTRQIQELKKENQLLQQQVHGLRSNPQTIGRYAREELHLARPGEIIYILPQQKPKSDTTRSGNGKH
jgi:cell division protein FtsB